MALYDANDFYGRLRALWVKRWSRGGAFSPPTTATSQDAGLHYATFAPIAAELAFLFGSFAYARLQTLITTSTDSNLDQSGIDWKGGRVPRLPGESDAAYSLRLRAAIVAPSGCQAAVLAAIAAYFATTPDPTLIGYDAFDLQSDPQRGAYYGLVPGQFGIIFYHAIPVQNVWPVGRRRLGYDSIATDRSSFTTTTSSPYLGLTAAVANAKDWTMQPVYIISQGEPASLQAR